MSDREEPQRVTRLFRAWGMVLGVWIALFVFLGIIVVPLLFAQCTGRF